MNQNPGEHLDLVKQDVPRRSGKGRLGAFIEIQDMRGRYSMQSLGVSIPLTTSAQAEVNPPIEIAKWSVYYCGGRKADDCFNLLRDTRESFSLIVMCDGHAVNLNYDAQREEWLLIDPNFLPGKIYTKSEFKALEEMLFGNYSPLLSSARLTGVNEIVTLH